MAEALPTAGPHPLLLGPTEQLPWLDATFDVALAQLAVHFMADPAAGLGEMARVARPGAGGADDPGARPQLHHELIGSDMRGSDDLHALDRSGQLDGLLAGRSR